MHRTPEAEAFATEMLSGFWQLNPVVVMACNYDAREKALARGVISEAESAKLVHLGSKFATIILNLELTVSFVFDLQALEVLATDISELVSQILAIAERYAKDSIERVKRIMMQGRPAHPRFGYPIMSIVPLT